MNDELKPLFSSLAGAFPSAVNPLYTAREASLARGNIVVDLISGNVNQHGVFFPDEILKEVFLQALLKSKVYQPDSFGQFAARESVSRYYAGHGLDVSPNQILLTPGTSVSYSYCFQLLAEAGDEILCPSPSYPLFEMISRLAKIRLTTYRLNESKNWEIDLDYLESQITTRTRAIVVISPHNPTGAVTSARQLLELGAIAGRHQLSIISDEVFSEFLFDREELPRPAATDAPVVFTLNGFSKMFALAGMKLGWIVVSGDPDLVKKSLRTLEIVSDTFLPVNEVVQNAVPAIFERAEEFLRGYKHWVSACRAIAINSLRGCKRLAIVPPQGGFYLTARVGSEAVDEDQLVVSVLENCKALIHPGYFYDIPPAHIVMSFVLEHRLLEKTLERLTEFLTRS